MGLSTTLLYSLQVGNQGASWTLQPERFPFMEYSQSTDVTQEQTVPGGTQELCDSCPLPSYPHQALNSLFYTRQMSSQHNSLKGGNEARHHTTHL